MENEILYTDIKDTEFMTEDEFVEYGLCRMRAMLKLEKMTEGWLKEKNTPFQQLVLETAHHHVDLCEKHFGISRYDMRL